MAEIAIQIKKSKNLKHVGVAVRQQRLRASHIKGQENEDKKQWNFILYAFTDTSELANLETLLVQLVPSVCYLPASYAQTPLTGDSKKLHNLMKVQEMIDIRYKKQSFRVNDVEKHVARLTDTPLSELTFQRTPEVELAVGSLSCLIDAMNLLADVDNYGCYTCTLGSLDTYMQLDSAAIRSLNLLPDPNASSGTTSIAGGSVFEILNCGKTVMGRRLLEQWIRMPLLDLNAILERQNIVNIFVENASLRMELLDECLKAVPDFEKLSQVLEKKKSATITDLVTVYDAAKDAIPRIMRVLKSASCSLLDEKYVNGLGKIVHDLQGYIDLIEEVVDLQSRPNLVVNAKHDEELQCIRNDWNDVQESIEEEHQRALNEIGGDIKCEADKVRTFVFRLIQKKEEARLSKISDVHICQVLVNGIQFTTKTLKELSAEYRRLKGDYEKRQAHLLSAAVDVASTYVPVLEATTALISELDILVGFAHAACHAGTGYSRPNLTVGGKSINIKSSRHPCVELQDGIDFIPNDYLMEHHSSRFQIVTGPNMGGKSTYIRQLGTIAVMAQIGSFVPANFCELPIIDKLLVRVGAGDLQQRGVSTFMLEMLEASSILHKATANSLVIIDELGRGTSTYDGFGLAWAISVYLLKNVQCMCLFATHFHELTALANDYDQGVVNKHVSAFTNGKEITMNYTIQDGPCMESFGVHVAAMAGFPEKVVASAKRKSQELEATPLTGITGTMNKKHKSTNAEHMSQKSILTAFAALPLDKIGSNQDLIQAVSALFKSN